MTVEALSDRDRQGSPSSAERFHRPLWMMSQPLSAAVTTTLIVASRSGDRTSDMFQMEA